jgi:ubiquitin-conjugating enzyme E2 G1
MNNDDLGASIGLVDDNDLFRWSVIFEGPEDTLYEGGYFKAELKFPEDYPNNPPEMRFISKMWHPNIYPDGKVCISILHAPGTDELNS